MRSGLSYKRSGLSYVRSGLSNVRSGWSNGRGRSLPWRRDAGFVVRCYQPERGFHFFHTLKHGRARTGLRPQQRCQVLVVYRDGWSSRRYPVNSVLRPFFGSFFGGRGNARLIGIPHRAGVAHQMRKELGLIRRARLRCAGEFLSRVRDIGLEERRANSIRLVTHSGIDVEAAPATVRPEPP